MNIRAKRICNTKVVEENSVIWRIERRVPGDTLAIFTMLPMSDWLHRRTACANKLRESRRAMRRMIQLHQPKGTKQ